MPGRFVDETARRIGVAVGEGDIGFDVEDGRSVAQVGAEHMNNRAVIGELDAIDFDAGQPNGVGAEWASGCEHSHAFGPA